MRPDPGSRSPWGIVAAVPRVLSESLEFRRLSLKAKAALPLLWAWSDHQGRLLLDAEALAWHVLKSIPEILQDEILELFREYEAGGWGLSYEPAPGVRAWQWIVWAGHRSRWRRPSSLPAPPGWDDRPHTPRDEPWYRRRQAEREARALERKARGIGRTRPLTEMDPDQEMSILRGRYTERELVWIDEAISAIRAHQKLDPRDLVRAYRTWSKYPSERVAQAAETFVARGYGRAGRGLPYLAGIIRNWEKYETPPSASPPPKNGSRIVSLLLSQYHSAPNGGASEADLRRFRTKLVDLLVAEGVARPRALGWVRALRVQEWARLETSAVESLIRSTVSP